MKNTKKILALILSAIMLFSVMTAVIVTKAETNVIYIDANATTDASAGVYKTFEEAAAAATAGTNQAYGTTIKFLSDYSTTTTSGLQISKKYVIVDLNGHTIDATTRAFYSKGTGILYKNGTINISDTLWYGVYADQDKTIVENITFNSTAKKGATTANIPGGFVRNNYGQTVTVRNCSFNYTGSALSNSTIAMLSANYGTINVYNSTFDGGGSYSAFAARGMNSSGYGKINLYDTDVSNVNYLMSATTKMASTVNTVTTIHSGKLTNIAKWAYEADFCSVVPGSNARFALSEDGEAIELASLSAPYSFYAVCEH
ncbi:MAG: hypothetical protein IIW72_08115, partial [Clostridia bacterium]|nr:hypothetical protein [Clostridia bacterium]